MKGFARGMAVLENKTMIDQEKFEHSNHLLIIYIRIRQI